MHTAYRLYNVLCTLHLPVAVLLLLWGVSGSFHYLAMHNSPASPAPQFQDSYYHPLDLTLLHLMSLIGDNSSDTHTTNNNTAPGSSRITPLVVVEERITLSASYFISSISACVYALIYLSFFHGAATEASKQSRSISHVILSSSYYYSGAKAAASDEEQALFSPIEDSDPTEISKWSSLMLLSEMVFWSFFVAYSYAAIASNTLRLGTFELLYLRLLVHVFCIYTICSQNNKAVKRVDIPGSVAFIALIGETFLVISMASNQINLVMAYFHRFLDFLLVLGHRWDMNPSWEVVLNCRLFFVAIGGALLHADMILSA
jgi:hypothetical protein